MRNRADLLQGGWRVATVWECSLREGLARCTEAVVAWLRSSETELDFPASGQIDS